MPTLAQLRDNSVPVVLNYFQFVLNCEVFIERLSSSNAHLVALEKEGEALSNQRVSILSDHKVAQLAARQAHLIFDDEEALWATFQNIEVPTPKKGKKKEEGAEISPLDMPNTRADEMRRQLAQVQAAAEEQTNRANAELEAVDARLLKNACQRIAHLLKSWDLTDDEKPVATDAKSVEKAFAQNPEIIMGWLQRTGEKNEEGQDIYEEKPGLLSLIESAKFGAVN